MAEIGRKNVLNVVRETENGFYLDGENLGEILMPGKFITDEIRKLNKAEVFIYSDSEDRLVATTEIPLAYEGEFAFLKVKSVSKFGAFLDWGLPKDLLVPFSEQKINMVQGKDYLVHVYADKKTTRMVASAKIDKFLDNKPPDYQVGEKVDLLIVTETDLGYKAIINDLHWGMLYKNQVFEKLYPGQKTKGYISKIRDDEKIDLLTEKPGYEKIDSISQKILDVLKENRGFMAVTDKTSPEIISSLFGTSKKNYKKAIGLLFKNHQITIENRGIRIASISNN